MADSVENTIADIDRKEKLKQDKELLSNTITNEIKKIFTDPSGKSFIDFLKAAGNLHTSNMSFRNTLLMAAQKPDATLTMGYNDWQAAGYQVKKGAKSVKIYTPEFAKNYSENGLANSVLKALDNQLEKNPSQSAEYALGISGYKFTKNTKGDLSVSVNGKSEMQFSDSSHFQNYINKYVIGKVPVGMNVSAVFDIADTYAMKEAAQQKLIKPAKINKNDTQKAELLTSVLKEVRPEQDKRSDEMVKDSSFYEKMMYEIKTLAIAQGVENFNKFESAEEVRAAGDFGTFGGYTCMSVAVSQCLGGEIVPDEDIKRLGRVASEWGADKTQEQLESKLLDIFKDCKALLKDIEKALDSRGLNINLEPKETEKMTAQKKDIFIKSTLKDVDSKTAWCEKTRSELAKDYNIYELMKPTIKTQGYLVRDIEAKLKDISSAANRLREPVKPHIENNLVSRINEALSEVSLIESKFNELQSLRENHARDDKDAKDAKDTLSSKEWSDSMSKLASDSKDGKQEQKEQQTAKNTQNKEVRQEAGAVR